MNALTKCLVLVIILSSSQLKSQIGINTLSPDSSAALDVNPKLGKNAGILIPRLTQAQRIAIPLPSRGLMVYDITDDLFYVNLTSGIHSWYAINPWVTTATTSTSNVMYTHNTVTNVGIGTSNPSSKLEVIGDIKASVSVNTNTLSANTLTIDGFPVNPLVPTGAIMMWSGSSAPPGWALCDGTIQSGLQTPNLKGRFIVGYDPLIVDYDNPGNLSTLGSTTSDIGGEQMHTLTKAELPKHNHFIGNGTDGASLSNSGNHQHSYETRDGTGHETGNATNNLGYVTKLTGGAGDHSHSGTSGDGTSDGLNSQPHENRPPYYVLAYIIKL